MLDIRAISKIFLDFIYDNHILPKEVEDVIEERESMSSSEKRLKYDIRVVLNLLEHRDDYKNYYAQDLEKKCGCFRDVDASVFKWLRDSENVLTTAIDFCNEFFHNVSNNTGADTFSISLRELIESAPNKYQKVKYLEEIDKIMGRKIGVKRRVVGTTGIIGDSSYGREGRANDRIPIWAKNPTKYNHIIVWSYFCTEDLDGQATKTAMLNFCKSKGMTEQQFRSNYAAMKTDSGRSHGHVFDDDGENVYIWDEVKDTLLQYKSEFYKG